MVTLREKTASHTFKVRKFFNSIVELFSWVASLKMVENRKVYYLIFISNLQLIILLFWFETINIGVY